jgi:hypothetical protein
VSNLTTHYTPWGIFQATILYECCPGFAGSAPTVCW